MDVAFKARARTLDMLGRQQIVGIPTAISELFPFDHSGTPLAAPTSPQEEAPESRPSSIRQLSEKRLNHGVRLRCHALRVFPGCFVKSRHGHGTERIRGPEGHTEKGQSLPDC